MEAQGKGIFHRREAERREPYNSTLDTSGLHMEVHRHVPDGVLRDSVVKRGDVS